MSEHHDHSGNPHSAAEWDERYSGGDRLWTAQVNPALAREVVGLAPGRALDVGSGEGADARWLADHGWTVVAVDISQVALDRAAEIDSRETISWVKADLTVDEVPGDPSTSSGNDTGTSSGNDTGTGSGSDTGTGSGSQERAGAEGFDLVALHYFPVEIDRVDVITKLVDALAPGATLLVVAHDADGIRAHGHDPDAYFQPKDIAERFADRLDVEILATVPRGRPAGGASDQRHMDDVVLKATRRD
ncbi:MAG: class I SAM-dependent methyltransferase [Gordonia sp. (in: high G+C Gram-positive bacteria)]|uniref:class I SAM-dependent methyltransferase n=1 Tax=Gordonia sp. (in: high G+C Gram-positive bacteria) TaxID=84139 RepID=UPI003BB52EC8